MVSMPIYLLLLLIMLIIRITIHIILSIRIIMFHLQPHCHPVQLIIRHRCIIIIIIIISRIKQII